MTSLRSAAAGQAVGALPLQASAPVTGIVYDIVCGHASSYVLQTSQQVQAAAPVSGVICGYVSPHVSSHPHNMAAVPRVSALSRISGGQISASGGAANCMQPAAGQQALSGLGMSAPASNWLPLRPVSYQPPMALHAHHPCSLAQSPSHHASHMQQKHELPAHRVTLAANGCATTARDASFHIQPPTVSSCAASDFQFRDPRRQRTVGIHVRHGGDGVQQLPCGGAILEPASRLDLSTLAGKTRVFNGLVPAVSPGLLSVAEAKAVMEADDDNQKDLLPALCARLERAVLNGDHLLPTVMQDRSGLTGLHPLVVKFSGTIPSMTVTSFVERVRRYSQASTQAYATGAVILQRLCSSTPAPLFLHSRSFQRLLIVAFMLAAKLYDDIYLSNKVWAKIGGISVSEINDLELVFLKALGWSAAVPREEYEYFTHELRWPALCSHLPSSALPFSSPLPQAWPKGSVSEDETKAQDVSLSSSSASFSDATTLPAPNSQSGLAADTGGAENELGGLSRDLGICTNMLAEMTTSEISV